MVPNKTGYLARRPQGRWRSSPPTNSAPPRSAMGVLCLKTGKNSMQSHERIVEKLNMAQIKFSLIHHDPLYTMDDVLTKTNFPIHEQIKCIACTYKRDNYTIILIVGITPHGRLDYKKLASHLGVSRSVVKIINHDEVSDLLHMPIGAIGLVTPDEISSEIILSTAFKNNKTIYFGSGKNDTTIMTTLDELKKVVNIAFAEIEK